MIDIALRLVAETGPVAAWTAAAVLTMFVLYVGIVMVATLAAHDPWRAQLLYLMFRDLLRLFRRR